MRRLIAGVSPKHAFVEFLIIVVGVLAALGVDEARQWRSDRVLEREYLNALLEEVVGDLPWLAAQQGDGPLEWLARLDAGPVEDTVHTLYDLRIATFFATLPPSRGVFDELTSTGGLLLIRDVELRRAIVAYYGWLAHIQPLDDYMEQMGTLDSRPVFLRHVDPVAWARISAVAYRGLLADWDTLDEASRAQLQAAREGVAIMADFDGLRSDPDARAELAMIEENGAFQAILYAQVTRQGRQVHAMIRAELGLDEPGDELKGAAAPR